MPCLICFDLEGPLSPQDNAYELMGLVKNGYKIFEVISRYDDLLTIEGRANYEPGDTLALIAPLLVYHKISEKDIQRVSERALIINGAKELILRLKARGCACYIISTSYEQHAHNIGKTIGIPLENIMCTRFPLDSYIKEFENGDFSLIENLENDILTLYPPSPEKDAQIKERLDEFFFKELPKKRLGKILKNTVVIGGERKVSALRKIAKKENKELNGLVVVGDSITDFKMLKTVHESGGLAIVFNGNEYAIPYGTIAVASYSLLDLLPVLEHWEDGGRVSAINFVKSLEKKDKKPYYTRERCDGKALAFPSNVRNAIAFRSSERVYEESPIFRRKIGENRKLVSYELPSAIPKYHYLGDKKDFRSIIEIHKNIRKLIRGEAGKLG